MRLRTLVTAALCAAIFLSPRTHAGAQSPAAHVQHPAAAPASQAVAPARFVDITEKAGVHFQQQALHTTRKYLLETMGSGVALFDCDNDGRLDLFLVNGAPYSDPTPPGFIPQKSGPQD